MAVYVAQNLYVPFTFPSQIILWEQMQVHFSQSGLHILDLNISNDKEAPSRNKILTTEFALMEAAWDVSRISCEPRAG